MDAPAISPLVLRFFRRIVRGYFRRHFSAVRLTHQSAHAVLSDPHLILYANHGSWWDPMVCVLLAEQLMPQRRHFAPMDAASLERYAILKKIGVFGVEMLTARGAARFIRGGLAILAKQGVLWVTPQGRFADARERPLGFKPGMAALAAKVPGGCTLQPLAIEYVFWNERLPEVLLHFGKPVHVDGQSAATVNQAAETELLSAMETLRELALRRDPSAFVVLRRGRQGTGGFYTLFERLRGYLPASRSADSVSRQPGVPANAPPRPVESQTR